MKGLALLSAVCSLSSALRNGRPYHFISATNLFIEFFFRSSNWLLFSKIRILIWDLFLQALRRTRDPLFVIGCCCARHCRCKTRINHPSLLKATRSNISEAHLIQARNSKPVTLIAVDAKVRSFSFIAREVCAASSLPAPQCSPR